MQQIPNKPNNETLSQLMDGEWEGLDPSRCAAGVCKDDALRATWARYHLIRDVVNNEQLDTRFDLAARVRSAIDDEPAYTNVTPFGESSEPVTLQSDSSVQAEYHHSDDSPGVATGVATGAVARAGIQWGSLAAGAAIAASVALVTVVGLNAWQVSPDNSSAVPSQANAASLLPGEALPGEVLPEIELVANRSTHWVRAQPARQAEAENRLNMFLSQHIENSATSDRLGMLPYSRLVGYDEIVAE